MLISILAIVGSIVLFPIGMMLLWGMLSVAWRVYTMALKGIVWAISNAYCYLNRIF